MTTTTTEELLPSLRFTQRWSPRARWTEHELEGIELAAIQWKRAWVRLNSPGAIAGGKAKFAGPTGEEILERYGFSFVRDKQRWCQAEEAVRLRAREML